MCAPETGCTGDCGGTQSPYFCGYLLCDDCGLPCGESIVEWDYYDVLCEDCADMRREREEKR